MSLKTLMIKNNSLKRNKILKSKIEIDQLFTNAQSISSYPVRLVFLLDQDSKLDYKTSFSVSKRRFKRAVDRNRIKRLLREAFRTQQHKLEPTGIKMMWMYTGKNMPTYAIIYNAIEKLLIELNQKNGHS